MGMEGKESIRKEAEARLEAQGGRLDRYGDLSTGALLHELQVHQIELELQNEELKRSRNQLQEERNRYNTLLDLAPVGFFHLDMEGRVHESNQAAANILRLETGSLKTRKFTDFILPEDQDIFYFHFQNVLKKGAAEPEELRMLRSDGTSFYVRIESSSVMNTGEGGEIFSVIMDIDEMLNIRRDLENARDAAELANRTKSQFLANMSHEIRTPMNGIMGMLELVLMSDLEDEQKKHLELAKTSADSLLGILNDILDLSKIEADKLALKIRNFFPADLIRSTSSLFKVAAENKGLKLTVSVDPKVPEILVGDPVRLRQILYNLLSNAVKFTDTGKIFLEMQYAGDSMGRHSIRFSCRDSGIGIPEEWKVRLFENFSQFDETNTRRYGGTGLGLAISSRLVEMMGGVLEVESEEGKGSIFHFTLDFKHGEGTLSTAGIAEEGENAFGARRAGKNEKKGPVEETGTDMPGCRTLLIAEDNAINMMVVSEFLSGKGWKVQECRNGKEAVEQFLNSPEKPCVILMDVQMPVMDGYEATGIIRQQGGPEGEQIPIIAMTAHAMASDKELCIKAGMNDYVAKPIVSMEGLFRKIEDLAVPEVSGTRGYTILIGENENVSLMFLRGILGKAGYRILECYDGDSLIKILKNEPVDLAVLAMDLPGVEGQSKVPALLKNGELEGLPVILLSGEAEEGSDSTVLEGKVAAVLEKPVDRSSLLSYIEQSL